MDTFISRDLLDRISYRSCLEKSLRQISLSKTPIEVILEDVAAYRNSYFCALAAEPDLLALTNLVHYRFKSDESILLKYQKTLREHKGFKQCFNDVLGFRLHFEEYPDTFPDYFRVVDLRKGKARDDGYRAIHLYYQRDSHSYPIEVQLWCGADYRFNLWSHQYIYKYKSLGIGRRLYEEFAAHNIPDEQMFYARLKYWEAELNGK